MGHVLINAQEFADLLASDKVVAIDIRRPPRRACWTA